MHLRTTVSPHTLQILPLSSAASYSCRTSRGLRPRAAALRPERGPGGVSVRCSFSQIHSYGTVDYEQRPALKWSSLYRRIATMEDPSAGAASIVQRWDEEERRLSRWELCRIVKELRKFRRFNLALEVYDWMTSQGDRFTFTSSDMAIKLDLIAKVHGITPAEEHFSVLPDALKDKRTYGALLNAYGHAKMKEKAEATLEIMRNKGYAIDALPFNVIMTLYLNVDEHEKVNTVINEMKEKNVALDVFSYNIWITNCAAMEDTEEMERVVERMSSDSRINANWTTYSTLATMYIKLGNNEKAHSSLKDAELRMTGRDRTPFNFLLGLYSTIGKREDVYRIWNWYKSSFPIIMNLGYQSMLSSLLKLGDIEGAEMIYENWLSVASNYDPRICNILLGWYAREGLVDKAKSVLDRLLDGGGKPKPITWEILAEGYVREKQISHALSCMKEAASYKVLKNWRPNPTNIANLLALCEEENDTTSVDILMGVLQNIGCLEKEEYKLLFSTYGSVVHGKKGGIQVIA